MSTFAVFQCMTVPYSNILVDCLTPVYCSRCLLLILSHKKKIHENHTMYFMYAFRCSVILSCSKMFLGDLGSIA